MAPPKSFIVVLIRPKIKPVLNQKSAAIAVFAQIAKLLFQRNICRNSKSKRRYIGQLNFKLSVQKIEGTIVYGQKVTEGIRLFQIIFSN